MDKYLNKIVEGDCLEVMKKIPDNCIDLILTDPPYGVKKTKWDITNYEDWLPELFRLLKPTGSVYIFGAIYTYDELLSVAKKLFKHKNTLCWLFPNGMSRLTNNYQIIYDPIFFGTKTDNYYFNQDIARLPYTAGTNKRLKSPVIKGGREWKPNPLGRKLENILVEACLAGNMAKSERTMHPTQKPLKLIKRLIEVSSKTNDLVLDPFIGSGTTAKACKDLGRNFVGIELEPEYVEIARQRLAQDVL